MGGAFVGFVFLIVVALLFGALFTAMGMLLFVKPKGIRPPWWDWGMNNPKPIAKEEEVPAAEIAPIVAVEKLPETAEPEPIKPELPRW